MNTRKTVMCLFGVITTLATTSGCLANPSSRLQDATVRVRVVDNEGQPIGGVYADCYSLSDFGSHLGLTDTNGMYSVQLRRIFAEISGDFTKTGYYKSSGVFWKWSEEERIPSSKTNFVIVMKRIVAPVQMSKKEIKAVFPRLDEPVGFDLEIGDWVFPDGKGKVTDILLTGEGHYNTVNDYSFRVTVEFAGNLNGIQSFYVPKEGAGTLLRSELPPPPIAPESGYEKLFERSIRRLPVDRRFPASSDETRRWIYRIRTKVDENGKIISANYGWMTKDFSFGNPNGVGVIVLNYYYNPDPKSRSLEPKEIADRQIKTYPEKKNE